MKFKKCELNFQWSRLPTIIFSSDLSTFVFSKPHSEYLYWMFDICTYLRLYRPIRIFSAIVETFNYENDKPRGWVWFGVFGSGNKNNTRYKWMMSNKVFCFLRLFVGRGEKKNPRTRIHVMRKRIRSSGTMDDLSIKLWILP